MITSAIFLIKTLGESLRSLYTISPTYTVVCILVWIVWLFATVLGIKGMNEAFKKPTSFSDAEAAAASS